MNEQVPIRTRSWLFTPATRPERFAKAAEIGADVLLIDLEDAVAPRDKSAARTTALDYLAGPRAGTLRALRINGLDTRAGIAESRCAAPGRIDRCRQEAQPHLRAEPGTAGSLYRNMEHITVRLRGAVRDEAWSSKILKGYGKLGSFRRYLKYCSG